MSVENKIRELLTKKQLSEEVVSEATAGDTTNPTQGSSQSSPAAGELGAGSVSKDTSIPSKTAGDKALARQGSSQDPSYDERDGEANENQGAKASASVGQDDLMQHFTGNHGEGTPNFTTVADPASVVNQPNSKGNVQKESVEEEDEDLIDDEDLEDEDLEDEDEDLEEDFTAELAALFDGNEDLSEEFRGKASSLFEAMVTAATNVKVAEIEDALIEEAANQINEYKNDLVEKIDSYLTYVAEQWVEQNELAVENGLRADITESFIDGMKNLFAEHYIDVPEEKYDVLGEMQAQIDELADRLDETLSANVELHAANIELQKESVLAKVTEDLAKTDAERFAGIVNDVEFENAEIFEEKLNVIKENYFPSSRPISEGTLEDGLETETQDNTVMSIYANAISKAVGK